jgi:hypothetical protein
MTVKECGLGAFFAEYRKKPGFAGVPPLRGHFVPLQSHCAYSRTRTCPLRIRCRGCGFLHGWVAWGVLRCKTVLHRNTLGDKAGETDENVRRNWAEIFGKVLTENNFLNTLIDKIKKII